MMSTTGRNFLQKELISFDRDEALLDQCIGFIFPFLVPCLRAFCARVFHLLGLCWPGDVLVCLRLAFIYSALNISGRPRAAPLGWLGGGARGACAYGTRCGAGAAGAVAASSSLISLASSRDTALSSAPSSCSCKRRSNSLCRWCCSARVALRFARSVSSSAWRRASGSLPACRQEVGECCQSPARAGRAAGCRSRRTRMQR
jgi:hypothetical protein